MNNIYEKIKTLAELIEKQQIERLKEQDLDCQANIDNCKVTIKAGRKYTKINIGYSGKFMIDKDGRIYGIKAYNQIHKGHYYGTLDTINEYFWGSYSPYRHDPNKIMIVD